MDDLFDCGALFTHIITLITYLGWTVTLITIQKNYSTLIADTRISVSIIGSYAIAIFVSVSGLYMCISCFGELPLWLFIIVIEHSWATSYVGLGFLSGSLLVMAHQHQRQLRHQGLGQAAPS